MSEPTISAIIPVYNGAAFVGKAIASALGQTYPPIEVIVVDDGSTDATVAVVEGFGDAVRLIQRPNGGPAAARNTGAEAATGTWLALLDADDTWRPDKLARQLRYLDDPAVGVVHARKTLAEGLVMPPTASFDLLWAGNCIINSSALIRRRCYDDLGGFDEDRRIVGVEDYNFWLRAAADGWVIATCPEWLVRYTPAPDSLSRNEERLMHAEMANIENVAKRLGLSASVVAEQQRKVLATRAAAFLYTRRILPARRAYAELLRRDPSLENLAGLIMSYCPVPLLNLRRRLVHGPAPERRRGNGGRGSDVTRRRSTDPTDPWHAVRASAPKSD